MRFHIVFHFNLRINFCTSPYISICLNTNPTDFVYVSNFAVHGQIPAKVIQHTPDERLPIERLEVNVLRSCHGSKVKDNHATLA